MLERGVEKRQPSYTVTLLVGMQTGTTLFYGEQCGDSLKNEIKLPYDPAIPLLVIYTEKTRTERDTCTLMFIAALFTIART